MIVSPFGAASPGFLRAAARHRRSRPMAGECQEPAVQGGAAPCEPTRRHAHGLASIRTVSHRLPSNLHDGDVKFAGFSPLAGAGWRMAPSMDAFPAKLGFVMEQLNLSRVGLANELAVDKSVVGRWLTGVNRPTGNNLTR